MSTLRFFLVCALALGCAACKKDEKDDVNTSREISIQMRFSEPEIDVKPMDRLTGLRQTMERVFYRDVHLDTLFRNRYGFRQGVEDSRIEGALFPKQDFALGDLRKATAAQMEALFGGNLIPFNQNDMGMWQAWNGRTGKACRIFQILVQYDSKGEVIFLAINTGQPIR